MALSHLVDTSVLNRLGIPAVRGSIERLAAAGALGRTSISDLEVGYSARNAHERADLMAALEPSSRLGPRQRTFSALCRCDVLHFDADFDQIASVTGQGCEWVVRAGAIN